MKISYIYPSKSRRQKFFDGLDNISSLSDSKDYEVICAFDEDDITMNNDDVREKLQAYENVQYFYGYSENKIAACNREANKISPDTSIICLYSDDMRFLIKGFDIDIRESFTKHFPNLDGCVHFPDSNAIARTMTMTMMGINLYKQLGYLYWPEYQMVYADNDLTEMTRLMGKYVFVDKNILDHFHPIWQMADWDEQYKKSESSKYYQRDHLVFLKRKKINFGV